jgi:thiol-disulfide isomerase/thioredoxin
MKEIIMFHGASCPHCHAMMPLVDRLEKEEKIKVIKKEVWNNEKKC